MLSTLKFVWVMMIWNKLKIITLTKQTKKLYMVPFYIVLQVRLV